jgi:hypothetical protein
VRWFISWARSKYGTFLGRVRTKMMSLVFIFREMHRDHLIDAMGELLSKEITYSIDVSGNNNYVLMSNGVPINLSFILQNITQRIIQENRRTTTHDAIIAMLVTMVMTIMIMMIPSFYLIKCYRASGGKVQIEDHRTASLSGNNYFSK